MERQSVTVEQFYKDHGKALEMRLVAGEAVFGEGPATASLVLVGEQPGDKEDLAGKPFVGPAGQMLDRALQEAGTGDGFDLARAVPLKPGSVMMHPAKASHWDGSAGNETVIVQIMGEGPATTTPIDPTQPFWIEVAP